MSKSKPRVLFLFLAILVFSYVVFYFEKQSSNEIDSPKILHNDASSQSKNASDKELVEQSKLEKNKDMPNENIAKSTPNPPGIDPFKEFLEKQKQKSKEQVISPFGTN